MKEKRGAGRPPKAISEATLTERLEMKLTPEMKGYIMAHGGGAFLRGLVEAHKGTEDASVQHSGTQ